MSVLVLRYRDLSYVFLIVGPEAIPVTKRDFSLRAILSPRQLLEDSTFGMEARKALRENEALFLVDEEYGFILLASQVGFPSSIARSNTHNQSLLRRRTIH